MLSRFVDALTATFDRVADKHGAHQAVVPILQDMASHQGVLAEILERHVERAGALNVRHYPVVSCDITHNPHFGLVANCWIPLPDGGTDLSTKAIHHHGDMLLTTITAFGAGYEHWTFTAPQLRDRERHLYALRLIERGPHPVGHVAFVDSGVAHVPFYPKDVTVTFALWSAKHATSWRDRMKRLPLLHHHSSALRRLGTALGFSRALDLKIARYFDFTPTRQGFQGIKDREEFPRGPNADYLQSLFSVVQRTGSQRIHSVIERQLDRRAVEDTATTRRLLDDLRSDRPIEPRLSSGHYGAGDANFTARQIEEALEATNSSRATS